MEVGIAVGLPGGGFDGGQTDAVVVPFGGLEPAAVLPDHTVEAVVHGNDHHLVLQLHIETDEPLPGLHPSQCAAAV